MVRQARLEDQPAITRLIDGIYHLYGDRLRLDRADSDLVNIQDSYLDAGGIFGVVEDNGRIIATGAALPAPGNPRVCVLRRLYVDPAYWGTGLGNELMKWGLGWAREHDMVRIEFWSDVRFARAHAFFRKWRFNQGPIRHMTDGWMPYDEYFFFRDVSAEPSTGRD